MPNKIVVQGFEKREKEKNTQNVVKERIDDCLLNKSKNSKLGLFQFLINNPHSFTHIFALIFL